MRRFPTVTKKRSRIEIIPMIDVMMFLLVFFVLISINVIPASGIKLNLPSSSSSAPVNTKIKIVVALSTDGSMSLSGDPVKDLSELKSRLLQLKSQGNSQSYQVVVSCDKQAQIQPLIDVMDVLKQTGLEAITMSTTARPT
jgi:biopolymer transport protein ExbD